MSPPDQANFERLLRDAHEVISGLDANRRMYELRGELVERFGRAVMYEVVLPAPEAGQWASFVARELPKLAEHLTAKKETVPGSASVAIFVWSGQEAHHFDAPTFWQSIADIEGCAIAELLAPANAGDTRGATTGGGPPLLLPAPVDDDR